MRRTKMDIIFDMLVSIRDKGGKIKPTHLLYKSNLSHKRMKEYLEELMQKSLVVEEEQKNHKMLALTEQGYDFLKNYSQLRQFTEAFGL